MKHTPKVLKIGLFGLLSGLMALHLSLTARSGSIDLLGSSILYWIAILFLLSRKRYQLNLSSDVLSSILGAFILSVVLTKSSFTVGNDIFIRIFPILSFVGVVLIASGIKGLKHYWQEISLFMFFIIAPGTVTLFCDPSLLTAKFAAFVLWSLGFNVSVQNVVISLPKGSIEVYSACSGIAVILQLLGICFIYLALYSARIYQKILISLVAVAIGFIVNGLRVALMAVLSAVGNKVAFEYWHLGNGSLIFSTIAVLIFGFFCQILLPQEKENAQRE